MTNTVFTKTYSLPFFNLRETARYMGDRSNSSNVFELISDCINECKNVFTPKLCYACFDVSTKSETVEFPFKNVRSKSLADVLCSCDSAVIFAATVGMEADRLIAKYSRISPSKALCFQAIGAERIEALCDEFNNEISALSQKDGYKTTARFSPGYGDLDLSFQKDIFNVLDCRRKIGLTLNDSMLMSPSKSVSAIIGIMRKGCI